MVVRSVRVLVEVGVSELERGVMIGTTVIALVTMIRDWVEGGATPPAQYVVPFATMKLRGPTEVELEAAAWPTVTYTVSTIAVSVTVAS